MRILGIDPGLGITGYGLIDINGDNFRLIEAGAIRSHQSESIDNRLSEIYQKLIRLIKETKPDVLVLEELYSHYKHPRTSILMGHARGVICLACSQCGIPLISYPSTRIKKSIVGRGHGSKEQIQRTVVSLLGLKRIPELLDVTDALALAMCHAYISKSNIKNQIVRLAR